jgi:lipid II:glycine glycyltransferase (peptidoglycan interpeptide bridge formation enzyme)
VRFRVETLPQGNELTPVEEKAFMNSVIDHCRVMDADMVIPATTNTVFRAYPDGADAAPYGSYIIDLTRAEEALWSSIDRITRQNINTAKKAGVTVVEGKDAVEPVHALVTDTFKRSDLPFMTRQAFENYIDGLGPNGKILLATVNGHVDSCAVFAASRFCAYAVYAGNVEQPLQGANKLLYWEAIRRFKQAQVQRFDFVGARIQPAGGSKQDGINALKRRMGATLKQGYIWKYPLSPFKYQLYGAAAKLRSGGDIVDLERHKLALFEAQAA